MPDIAKSTDPAKQVVAWMIEGHREDDIAASLAQHFPGTDPAKLLDAAVEHFANAARCPPEVLLGWALEAYRDLYRRTLEIGDFQGAGKMAKEIVGLLGQLKKLQRVTPPTTTRKRISR